ncbi:hypothetical protein NEMBOFW57_005711 [Staphylotrichum longicolle]|uniref:peptidyl-tRNA hydrolase n=1 Tax=Staphylotrichum longicolle TaxID=669026 RepID=A0AAD4EY07_9PEZI|nr:hypothetical protein NEMBOFW57_005711 [Staphylotrichum longicolle]
MSLRRILVISLGNPGEYFNTWHSAGHMVLGSLQRQLGPQQPAFSKQRIGKQNAQASLGSRYSLLQSPTYMNVSGPWVAAAYKELVTQGGLAPSEAGVVLVHDDLEEELGVVKIRDWSRSHRGHNGIKSVNGSLKANPAGKWARISIGIGRPQGRDKEAVSDFVLSKVSGSGKGTLEGSATRGVLQALIELEEKWRGEGSRL